MFSRCVCVCVCECVCNHVSLASYDQTSTAERVRVDLRNVPSRARPWLFFSPPPPPLGKPLMPCFLGNVFVLIRSTVKNGGTVGGPAWLKSGPACAFLHLLNKSFPAVAFVPAVGPRTRRDGGGRRVRACMRACILFHLYFSSFTPTCPPFSSDFALLFLFDTRVRAAGPPPFALFFLFFFLLNPLSLSVKLVLCPRSGELGRKARKKKVSNRKRNEKDKNGTNQGWARECSASGRCVSETVGCSGEIHEARRWCRPWVGD
ncbi:hypothetical protein LY76DRAFT_292365 [Colletotrichum caudatum]|nr:hypothetical protein LY76DRAFT_292365 [Colletotrichum caudatum]